MVRLAQQLAPRIPGLKSRPASAKTWNALSIKALQWEGRAKTGLEPFNHAPGVTCCALMLNCLAVTGVGQFLLALWPTFFPNRLTCRAIISNRKIEPTTRLRSFIRPSKLPQSALCFLFFLGS